MLDPVLGALHEAGLHGERARAGLTAVVRAVIGFVTVELSTTPEEDPEAFADDVRRRVAEIDPTTAPHLAALADRTIGLHWSSGADPHLDDGFEALLDLLVAGMRTGRDR